jgi:acylphosphatase
LCNKAKYRAGYDRSEGAAMAVTETVRISFSGHFVPPSFLEFVDRRAARLDLDVSVTSADQGRVAVEISGQPDLIDAFEMACSLGPLDCMILDCERTIVHARKSENGHL